MLIASFIRDEIVRVYLAIREYLYERVIKSSSVKEVDDICKEKIRTIYDYYIENIEIIMRKYKASNEYKLKYFGPERVVIDYIQWLGDANADMEYFKIIKKN